jgi:hypothetical protein
VRPATFALATTIELTLACLAFVLPFHVAFRVAIMAVSPF